MCNGWNYGQFETDIYIDAMTNINLIPFFFFEVDTWVGIRTGEGANHNTGSLLLKQTHQRKQLIIIIIISIIRINKTLLSYLFPSSKTKRLIDKNGLK